MIYRTARHKIQFPPYVLSNRRNHLLTKAGYTVEKQAIASTFKAGKLNPNCYPPKRHIASLPVWSKTSCGLTLVEFQQVSQLLALVDFTSGFTNSVLRSGKWIHIIFPLVISFTVKMEDVIG